MNKSCKNFVDFFFFLDQLTLLHLNNDIPFLQPEHSGSVGRALDYTRDRRVSTVLPTKSDSDVIFCLQLFSKTLISTLHFS